MTDKVVPNTGWAQEKGPRGAREDWLYMYLGPLRIHVWQSTEPYSTEKSGEWEIVMHYGDSTMVKQGFLTQEDACNYALNQAIDLTKGLLTTLEGYLNE